jgi:hypothetical protein
MHNMAAAVRAGRPPAAGICFVGKLSHCRPIPGLAPDWKLAQDEFIMSAEKPEVEAGPGKHRLIANVVLVAVWAYVAMIYLLALDQQFRWGIF